MHGDDHGIKAAWQTRWLVAVHLDPLVGLLQLDQIDDPQILCSVILPVGKHESFHP